MSASSLQDRYPDVAATWHDVRNGVRASEVASTSPESVWWRCLRGHEWSQTVASRTSMPEWKNDDRAACQECSGYRYWGEHACGHGARFTTAQARDTAATAPCSPCRKANAAHAYAEKVMEQTGVGALLHAIRDRHPRPEGIDFDPRATPPLIGNWYRVAVNRLQGLRRCGEHLTPAMARQVLEEVRELAHHLAPLPEVVDEAIAGNDLVTVPLTSQRMWPAGWLWHHDTTPQPPAAPGEDLAVATAITEHITSWATEAAHDHVHWSTSELTYSFTGQITRALHHHAPVGRVHTEALIPLTEDGRFQSGALDLVLCRTTGPDIVVELDSRHKPWSARKLAFARQAGAITVWVRFGDGQIAPQSEGAVVLDARDAASALRRGRTPPTGAVRLVAHDTPDTLFTL